MTERLPKPAHPNIFFLLAAGQRGKKGQGDLRPVAAQSRIHRGKLDGVRKIQQREE
jgi:hypothetical protein